MLRFLSKIANATAMTTITTATTVVTKYTADGKVRADFISADGVDCVGTGNSFGAGDNVGVVDSVGD